MYTPDLYPRKCVRHNEAAIIARTQSCDYVKCNDIMCLLSKEIGSVIRLRDNFGMIQVTPSLHCPWQTLLLWWF